MLKSGLFVVLLKGWSATIKLLTFVNCPVNKHMEKYKKSGGKKSNKSNYTSYQYQTIVGKFQKSIKSINSHLKKENLDFNQ